MKRFLAGVLCSVMLCTEILSASVFAATNTELTNPEELVSIEEAVAESTDEGQEIIALDETGDVEVLEDSEIIVNEPEASTFEAVNEEAILTARIEDIEGTNYVDKEHWTDGSKCFSVSENRLTFGVNEDTGKTYTAVPWENIKIPSYVDANGNNHIEDDEFVRVIPTGIFDNASERGSAPNIVVTFADNAQIETIEAGAFMNGSVKTISLPAPAFRTEVIDDEIKVVRDSSHNPVYCEITEIKNNTFKGDKTLEEVNLGAATEIITIGVEAFSQTKLKSFEAPAKLKVIKKNAFMGCDALRVLSLNNVLIIEEGAFSGCSVLGETGGTVTFTNSIRSIGKNAFEKCGFGVLDMSKAQNLGKTDPLDANDVYVAEYFGTYNYPVVGVGVFENCDKMTSITLPYANYVRGEGISEGMFSGCKKLTTVNFSVGVYTTPRFGIAIGKNAFENCESLVSIEFPVDIIKVGYSAFAGCTKLKEVQLPNSELDSENIADNAFPTNNPLVILKGCSLGLEKYCQEHSKVVKFQNIAQENSITYSVPNATYVASVSKAKFRDEITLKITPKKGYVLSPEKETGKLISAVRTAKNEAKYDKDIKLTLIACDSTSQTFSFYMPYLADKDDKLEIKANVVSETLYNKDENQIKVTVPETIEDGYTTLTDDYITKGRFNGSVISFKKTGEQVPLLMKDSTGRKMGPWRFKFESTDKTVATVTSDGVVTAKTNSNNKDAQILVTLLSTGLTVAIPVRVEESVEIDNMSFQFDRRDPRDPSKYIYKRPARVDIIDDGVWKYEEVTKTNPITKEKETYKEKFHYQLIVVPRTKVKKGEVTFTCEVHPRSSKDGALDKSYMVDTTWTSRDDSIATVETKKVVNNMNKITIQKDAVGETEIRVKVINEQLDKDDDNREYEYGFVVRIDDDIPRLAEKSFTINTYKEKGYELQIVEGFKSGADNKIKYEIANNKLKVVKADGTDMTSDFIITYDDQLGKYFIKETEKVRKSIAEGASKNFTKLFIRGEIKNNDDVANEGIFDIPLGTVTVTKLALESEISLTGNINTFYDARYEDEDHSYSGVVTLYQSNWDEKVEKYYLVTAEHHDEIQKKERTVEQYQGVDPKGKFYDELRANFTFGYITEKTGTVPIYRTRTEKLAQDEYGDDVVSGYVYIKYEGYKDYLYKEITIPVKKVKPKYVLDVTSGTASTLQRRQEYNVLLVNSSTKKLPVRDQLKPDGTTVKNAKGEVQKEYVDLLNEVFKDDSGKVISKAQYWFDVDTDGDVFDKTRTDFTKKIPKYVDPNDSKKIEEKNEYTSIPITVKNPYSDKAYLYVQLYNWAEPIKYTFTLKTTSALAKASVKPSKVILYTSAKKTPAEFKVTLNQKFAKLTVKNVTDSGIKVTFEQDKDNPYICVGKAEFTGSGASKGNYKFETEGKIHYSDSDGDAIDLAKPIKFTVEVREKEPEIKLKSSTFKMNSNVAGVELIGTKYSFKNLPAGDNKYAVISGNAISADYIPVKNAKLECITKDPKTKEPYKGIADKVHLYLGRSVADGDIDMVMVGLDEGMYQNGTYKFEVSKVQATDKYNNEIDLKNFKITVAIKKNAISVTQKAKGTINPVDPKSDTIYTPTFKNFGYAKIISANFVEQNKYGKAEPEQHFVLSRVVQSTLDDDKMQNISTDKNGIVLENQFMLTTNGKELVKDKTYYGIITYTLQDVDGKVRKCDTKKFKVSLAQKIPSVGLSFVSPKNADNVKLSTVMYSGSERDQKCTVLVMPKSQTNAALESIKVYLPDNASTKQRTIARAIEPVLFKVEAPKGATARETRALRMEKRAYKVYTQISGNTVCITKPAGYSISVNDVDPTNSRMYDCTPQVFDESFEAYFDDEEIKYYKAAVLEMQEEECKYYRSFTNNTSYEKKDGHYFVKIELLNSAAFTKDKATDVTFEVKYKNQMKKTTGTKFKITITLKK